jgi:hypothetical protein
LWLTYLGLRPVVECARFIENNRTADFSERRPAAKHSKLGENPLATEAVFLPKVFTSRLAAQIFRGVHYRSFGFEEQQRNLRTFF